MSIAQSAAMGAKAAWYSAAQLTRIAWYTGHYVAGRRRMGPLTRPGEAPPKEEFSGLDRARLRAAFGAVFQDDWRNIEAGEYKMPPELRRPPSLMKLARQSLDYFDDAGAVARRRLANGHSEVMTDDLTEKFPRYFLQNFHFQSDGWLSARSAERYGMQVETLFTGAGAAMRRQALPLIRRAIGDRDATSLHYLDLACGDGSFATSVLDNWPGLRISALDLSPAYLGKARAALSRFRQTRFIEAKAEATGLAEASVDIVTAVYLFHELPPKIRKEVAAEIARILKPGGVFILVDTIQFGDEPGLDTLLEAFPRSFHEPYYDSYCRLDLRAHFAAAGLAKSDERLAFLTKATAFQKQ
ncbi:MAG: class I SAM-dependent methyltransferase [Parvularculaceae bacterium]|nr:class I SAM-dependent methyltransferase [Parvularculaceae bacterium]